jgi:hypothetical protein
MLVGWQLTLLLLLLPSPLLALTVLGLGVMTISASLIEHVDEANQPCCETHQVLVRRGQIGVP